MATDVKIKPQPSARVLFGKMVARAVPLRGGCLHLSIDKTLELSVERVNDGKRDTAEINELIERRWIKQASDGGWLLS